jgi:hypothetical protein
MELMRQTTVLVLTLTMAGAVVRGRVEAQTAPRTTVLLADLTFNGSSANAIAPGDTSMARVATERLRSALMQSETFALADSSRAAEALAAGNLPGVHCSVSSACVRDAARKVGAQWAVMGTVSKVSNLIWYLSGQLIDVASGRLALDDGFELKGPPDEMVPRGASSLARRVAAAAARDTGDVKGKPGAPAARFPDGGAAHR